MEVVAGLAAVLCHALAGLVHSAKLELRHGQPPVGGKLVPLQGFGVVLRYTKAIGA